MNNDNNKDSDKLKAYPSSYLAALPLLFVNFLYSYYIILALYHNRDAL